ncbi:MAG: NADH-quinone oxidoreductase subunit NuoK [Candidatus Eiseniibacteriota bacterium]|nr:MAG: NADH-quinone oxidoreductase subunit NuoK [Candidatus Eisenbacteria bacterium]
MPVGVSHYLAVSAVIFAVGVAGVLLRRNILVVLMSIELMLNAANLAFVTFSRASGAVGGQIVVLFVMTVAAAEVAVGLAIVLIAFRARETTDVDEMNVMKW